MEDGQHIELNYK